VKILFSSHFSMSVSGIERLSLALAREFFRGRSFRDGDDVDRGIRFCSVSV
jgi:hypothetical protein